MRYCNTWRSQGRCYRLSFLTSLEMGLMRLVRLALRACRILVLARVRLSAALLPISNCLPHCLGSLTTRPLRIPDPQRQAMVSFPVLDRRQTFSCSVTNSAALTVWVHLLPRHHKFAWQRT